MAASNATVNQDPNETDDSASDIGADDTSSGDEGGSGGQGGASGHVIPKERLDQEIKKRRDLEARLARLEGENNAYKNRPVVQPDAPDPKAEEDQIWKEGLPNYVNRKANEAAFDRVTRLSIKQAKRQYSDWEEKKAYWQAHATQADVNALRQEDDPAEFAYEWAKRRMDPPETPEAARARMKAEILEELRGEGHEGIPAPETPKPKKTLDTLAGKRASGGREPAMSQPLTALQAARAVQHGKF